MRPRVPLITYISYICAFAAFAAFAACAFAAFASVFPSLRALSLRLWCGTLRQALFLASALPIAR